MAPIEHTKWDEEEKYWSEPQTQLSIIEWEYLKRDDYLPNGEKGSP